jgi:hypothetical protein
MAHGCHVEGKGVQVKGPSCPSHPSLPILTLVGVPPLTPDPYYPEQGKWLYSFCDGLCLLRLPPALLSHPDPPRAWLHSSPKSLTQPWQTPPAHGGLPIFSSALLRGELWSPSLSAVSFQKLLLMPTLPSSLVRVSTLSTHVFKSLRCARHKR